MLDAASTTPRISSAVNRCAVDVRSPVQARRSRLAIVLITVASSVWHVVVLSSTHCLQRVAYRLTPDGLTIDLCQDKRKFSGLRNDLVMMGVPSPHTLHTLRTLRALQTGAHVR